MDSRRGSRRWSRRAVCAGLTAAAATAQPVNQADPSRVTQRIRVEDATGAPVPDAYVVMLRHQTTNIPQPGTSDPVTVERMERTGADGNALLPVHPRGRYTVEVRAYGFLPWAQANVRPRSSVLVAVPKVGFFVLI